MIADYKSSEVPRRYLCADCGARGVKLWRPAHDDSPLRCADCACARGGIDGLPINAGSIDQDGRRPSSYGRTDQIGMLLPAVPDEEGAGFWGYTSVPDAGVLWWRRLPSRRHASFRGEE